MMRQNKKIINWKNQLKPSQNTKTPIILRQTPYIAYFYSPKNEKQL